MIIHEGMTLEIGLSGIDSVKVGEFIGAGASGNVWKVTDLASGKNYALKHIRLKHTDHGKLARFVLRMSEEAKVKIPSEYIVRSYGLARLDDLNYAILFEYVDGKDLDEWIAANPGLSWERKRAVFAKILQGVKAAHDLGIIHRDLKPQNIKITAGGIPKILDFGIASSRDTNLTVSRELSGTLPYMAPELLAGHKADIPADIYALGCILFYLVRERNYLKAAGFESPPWGKMMKEERLTDGSILDFDPAFNSLFPKGTAVHSAIRKSTTFNPAHRYTSIAELQRQLDAMEPRAGSGPETVIMGKGVEDTIVDKGATGGPPTTILGKKTSGSGATRSTGRRPVTMMLGVALILLFLSGGAWWLFRHDEPGSEKTSEVTDQPSGEESTTGLSPDEVLDAGLLQTQLDRYLDGYADTDKNTLLGNFGAGRDATVYVFDQQGNLDPGVSDQPFGQYLNRLRLLKISGVRIQAASRRGDQYSIEIIEN